MEHGCIDCKWMQYARSICYCMKTNKIVERDNINDFNCEEWQRNWEQCKKSKIKSRQEGKADYEQMTF